MTDVPFTRSVSLILSRQGRVYNTYRLEKEKAIQLNLFPIPWIQRIESKLMSTLNEELSAVTRILPIPWRLPFYKLIMHDSMRRSLYNSNLGLPLIPPKLSSG